MEFFRKETKIDFMGIRLYTGIVSFLLWVISIGLLVFKGLNFGLDFTGGTQIEVRFSKAVSPTLIREQLEQEGIHNVRVQQYGSTKDLLIRVGSSTKNVSRDQETHLPQPSGDPNIPTASSFQVEDIKESVVTTESVKERSVSARVKHILIKNNPSIEIRRTEFVGSEVGAQLVEQGGIAVLVSILATMIYIALRFEYRLAVSAAVGLCHDAFLILGIFALFGFEFDLATLASILAVLGYSLNDTIVVFDRVRENFRKIRKSNSVEIMNLSINQTLSRTIMTSWMTLLVVLALLLFGGENLFGFSMAFFVGIIIGTFSSIYVSGALALWMGLSRADLLPKPKTEAEGL